MSEPTKQDLGPGSADPLDPVITARLAAARAGDPHEFSRLTEPHRRELQVHCYRLLGSLHDAEDLVQETFLRAWRRLETFEGRAPLRAWLYKIATNACLDELDKRPRRGLPSAAQPAADPRTPVEPPLIEPIWLEPIPDEWLADFEPGPETHYTARESISLAFVAALQALPPRQRAVLILSDVLDWRAREIADLLGLTVSAANSALHRARTTLVKHYHARGTEAVAPLADDRLSALLNRYVQAWETADVAGLVALLKEDAAFTMPPSPSWYRGQADIRLCLATTIFAGEAKGRWRLRPARANAQPAFGLYQRDEASGAYRVFGLQVLHWEGEHLREVTTFLNPALFPYFGLPATLSA